MKKKNMKELQERGRIVLKELAVIQKEFKKEYIESDYLELGLFYAEAGLEEAKMLFRHEPRETRGKSAER